ncbi:MAG: hypothetical protein LUG47_06615 [Clostridiales bacterium]|nr:hypothetical protein [Clostridiales bacterium]
MTRNFVALPYEYLEEMEALSDEEFGRLCRVLLRYSMEGEPIRPEGNLRFYTRRVMNREDRFREGFADLQRKRSEAGKKGAEARWGISASPDANAMRSDSNAMRSDSNAMRSDSNAMRSDSKNGQTETKAETKTKTKTEAEAEAETGLLPAAAGEKGGPTASAPRRADRPTRGDVFVCKTGQSFRGERSPHPMGKRLQTRLRGSTERIGARHTT